MSLLDTIKSDLAKIVTNVENFFTGTVEPDVASFFTEAVQLVERNGGSLLLQAAASAVPAIAAGSWSSVVAGVLTAAKAAGAATIAAEEQLAASTALQIAQAAGGALSDSVDPNAPPTPATAMSVGVAAAAGDQNS